MLQRVAVMLHYVAVCFSTCSGVWYSLLDGSGQPENEKYIKNRKVLDMPLHLDTCGTVGRVCVCVCVHVLRCVTIRSSLSMAREKKRC